MIFSAVEKLIVGTLPSYKIIPSVYINFNITRNANRKIGKIGTKTHFMYRKGTYCTHF